MRRATASSTSDAAASDGERRLAVPTGRSYVGLLTWAFTLFNTARVAAYLPTMWAIYGSADSSQHSLWTWCIWLGANSTMALWLLEHNGRALNRAVLVNFCNAVLCAATVVLIVSYR